GGSRPAGDHDQPGHLHLPGHVRDRLEGRGLGADHLPGRAVGHQPQPVRGGRSGRGRAVAAAVAHHAARHPAGDRAAADPAAGRFAHGRLRAVHPAARRGGCPGGRGARHLCLLPRAGHPELRGGDRGGSVQRGGRADAGPDREQGRPQARRARDLFEVMTTPSIVIQPPPEKERRAVWEEQPTAAGQTGKGALLTFVVLMVLFPMWVIVVTSLSSRATINEAGGLVIVPRDLDFSAYVALFTSGRITRALMVSAFLATVGTAISLVLTILAAYGLSRRGSFAHRTLLFVFLLTFFIYPSLIPKYLVVTGLGLRNNLFALILPVAVN